MNYRPTHHYCCCINDPPQILPSRVFVLCQIEEVTLFAGPVPRQSPIYRPAVVDLVEVIQDNSILRGVRVSPSHLCIDTHIEVFYLRSELVFTPDQPVESGVYKAPC